MGCMKLRLDEMESCGGGVHGREIDRIRWTDGVGVPGRDATLRVGVPGRERGKGDMGCKPVGSDMTAADIAGDVSVVEG